MSDQSYDIRTTTAVTANMLTQLLVLLAKKGLVTKSEVSELAQFALTAEPTAEGKQQAKAYLENILPGLVSG